MTGGASLKRNERDGFKTTKELAKPSRHHRNSPARLAPHGPAQSSNQVLAGYLAHEFLTKRTLLGQPWGHDCVRNKAARREEKEEAPRKEKKQKEYEKYMEVAHLLKMDEIHLPRIVNPTQLTSFLQLRKDVLFT